MSCPNLFVPIGNSQLGGALSGLSICGGAAVGSLGAIQGLINVITTIEATIADPINVIQPAEPLLVSEAKPGRNFVRMARLVFNRFNSISPTIVSSGQGRRRKYPLQGSQEQL